MLPLLLATALLSSSIHVAPAGEGPFSDLGYDAALEQAKAKEKLLFVDFTASWCPPCKRMEAETWPQAEVRAWLGEHAIAIQVDVDKQPELAQKFGIEAMPTVVALRGGEEFDRTVGFKDAPGFLAWAKDIAAGKRAADELMERAKTLAESADVGARYDLARDLLRAKKYDLALTQYLWLWPNTRSAPGMGGVRLSFMLVDMVNLAKKHPPAKQAFLALLEDLQTKLDADGVPALQDWVEWVALCENFGQDARVLAWYEKRRDEQGRLFADKAGEPRADPIVAKVFDILMQADRPQDAVRLFVDARKRGQGIVAQYQQMVKAVAELDEASQDGLMESARRQLTGDISELYAALLSAGRGEEAGDVGAMLIQAQDTPDSRIALVRAGLAVAKQPEAAFTRWLDEAEAAGGNVKTLRRKLERLAAPKGATSEAGAK